MNVNDKGLTATVEIDDIEYAITYDLWIWTSKDGSEEPENTITVTNTVPYLDDDSEELKEIIEELWNLREDV
jgi:hypothetical protein